MKKDNRLVEVEWEEALSYVASQLHEHRGHVDIQYTPQMTIEAITSLYSLADYVRSRISAPVALDGAVHPLSLKMVKDNGVIIVMNTDMVSDFSPLLVRLRMRLKKQPTIIVIDSATNRLAENAALWLQPRPGKEYDVLKLIVGRKGMRNTTGISDETIASCRTLLEKKAAYVFYNPANINNVELPKGVHGVPLSSQINTSKIFDMGMDNAVDDRGGQKTISCLYAIGVIPGLSKKYKTVIVQNCYPPPFDFDVFLPVATFAETRGHAVSMDGKVKKIKKAIDPVGKSKPNDWIIQQVGNILNYDVKKHKPARRKRRRLHSYKNIKTNKNYPINLLVRENCYMYQGHPLSSLLKGFERLRDDTTLWISGDVAKKSKIKDAMRVNVIGRNINLELSARISNALPENSVLIYNHPSLNVHRSQPVRIECVSQGKED
jgi:hypothetical protein